MQIFHLVPGVRRESDFNSEKAEFLAGASSGSGKHRVLAAIDEYLHQGLSRPAGERLRLG